MASRKKVSFDKKSSKKQSLHIRENTQNIAEDVAFENFIVGCTNQHRIYTPKHIIDYANNDSDTTESGQS